MSISHKAWLFNYDSFKAECADLLYRTLQSGDSQEIKAFITDNHATMKEPWSLHCLRADWEKQIRSHPGGDQILADVQNLGDIALSKYFDEQSESGLGYGFDALHACLCSVPTFRSHAGALIGGYPFGPAEQPFDPGRQGTGFLSPGQVRQLLLLLQQKPPAIPGPRSAVYEECYYKPETAAEVQNSWDSLVGLYLQAADKGVGLLLADFT